MAINIPSGWFVNDDELLDNAQDALWNVGKAIDGEEGHSVNDLSTWAEAAIALGSLLHIIARRGMKPPWEDGDG